MPSAWALTVVLSGYRVCVQVPLEPGHTEDAWSDENVRAAAEELLAAEQKLALLSAASASNAASNSNDGTIEEASAALDQAKRKVAASKPPTLIVKRADVKGQLAKSKAAGKTAGALAGQAAQHKQKRKSVKERMIESSDKDTVTRLLAAETKPISTRQRNRKRLKDFKKSVQSNGTKNADRMQSSKQTATTSTDSKISMGTVFGWQSRDTEVTSTEATSTESKISTEKILGWQSRDTEVFDSLV